MKITEKYNDFTKEELLAECQSRGIEGVASHTKKDDIIAALELNDEQSDKEPSVTAPLPSPEKSNIPNVSAKNVPEVPIEDGGSFKDEDFTDGNYVMRKGDHVGEPFALCKHNPDVYGKTHTLKNNVHFWQGSEEQFRLAFEKA